MYYISGHGDLKFSRWNDDVFVGAFMDYFQKKPPEI